MKLKAAFSILITVFFIQSAFSKSGEGSIFERSLFQPVAAPDPLAGKKIAVRVYNELKNAPKTYKKINILYENRSEIPQIFNAALGNIQGDSVVVITAEDQTDEQVKSVITGSVLAEKLDVLKQKIHYISSFADNKIKNQNLFIDDALGELIPNAKVDIYIRDFDVEGPEVLLTSVETKDGSFRIPDITGSIRNFSFVISSPDYGNAIVSRLINNTHIRAPLVHKDSEAYKRAIRGKVVDPDGNPLENEVLECSNVRTLGSGLINPLNGGPVKSITGKDGKFCLYLPNEQNNERGYLIPPGSTYYIRIEAPKGLRLVTFDEPVVNDTEKIIVMEKADRFRTFVFNDSSGVIVDYAKLQFININIMRQDKRMLRIGYNELKEGGYFPLGEYKANMRVPGGGEYEFEPVMVDENSPDVIVMKLPESVIYSGQVVHGLTGQKMPGAFVIAFNGSKKGNFSMITKEQWLALHELPLEPELNDAAIKPVTDIYEIKKNIRTDAQGRFQMSFVPGEIYGFIAFDENYLAVMHRRFNLKFDERRIAQIPAIKLYPAATVVLNLQTEERISVNPNWIINEKDNPSWTKEFLAQNDKSEREYITIREWLQQNEIQSFHIPAGLNVRVKLETPYDEQWSPIEVPDLLNLSQGQRIDLGSFTFGQAVEVFVQVINSKGEPVEGIPVRTLVDNRVWSVSHNSDESGISSFHINPGSNIQFGVSYNDQDGKYMRKTISCDIKSQEDAGKLFTIQLSNEIIERIYQQGERL